jgi:hypothetical protein
METGIEAVQTPGAAMTETTILTIPVEIPVEIPISATVEAVPALPRTGQARAGTTVRTVAVAALVALGLFAAGWVERRLSKPKRM